MTVSGLFKIQLEEADNGFWLLKTCPFKLDVMKYLVHELYWEILNQNTEASIPHLGFVIMHIGGAIPESYQLQLLDFKILRRQWKREGIYCLFI